MSDSKKKTTPDAASYGPRGAALWRQYADEYNLSASDEALLAEACACVDLTEQLDALTRERGPLDEHGRVAAWVTEARFQKGIALKLLAQLDRLAHLATSTGSRRNVGGSRGAYRERGA